MDEVTLVRELGAETPLPSPDRLHRARTALMYEVAPPRKRRWPLLAAVAAAAVAAVAIPVAVIPAAEPAPAPRTGSAPGTPARAPEMTPVAAFLDQAAAAAEKAPDTVPRGDQYLYVRTVGKIGTLYETWLSIDGEHDNRSRDQHGKYRISPGCKNNRTLSDDGKTVIDCKPVVRYRPDMPTEPAAVADWIKDQVRTGNGDVPIDALGKHLGAISFQLWMRPAQQAALYRAIGMIDGMRLVEGVRDSRGRTGVGLAWTRPGDTEERVIWIFDPKTHRLVGTKDWTIDRIAVVDTLRQKG